MTTHPLSAHVLLVDINMEDIIGKFAAQLAATAGIAAVVGIPQSSSTNVAAGGIGSIISHRHGGEGIANCSIIANGGEGGGGGGGGSASSSEQTTSGRKGGSSPRGTSGRDIMDILEVARERWLAVRRCTWHTRMDARLLIIVYASRAVVGGDGRSPHLSPHSLEFSRGQLALLSFFCRFTSFDGVGRASFLLGSLLSRWLPFCLSAPPPHPTDPI